MHFDGPPPAVGHHVDTDLVRVVDNPANEMLDGVDDSAHSVGSAAASAGAASELSAGAASAVSVVSAFLAGAFFFFNVVASPVEAPSASARAALNRSSLDGLGSLTRSVPSAPGRPLNFCQSPVIFSRLSTGSVGWAPTLSQYCSRSEPISMMLGSSLGWYRPMTSMARPSRL